MSRTIVLDSRHQLGIEGVKASVSDRFVVLKHAYIDKIGTATLTWDGPRGHVDIAALGQAATVDLRVEPETIHIEIRLPWLLAGMAGMIETILTSNADALRPKAPAPVAEVAEVKTAA